MTKTNKEVFLSTLKEELKKYFIKPDEGVTIGRPVDRYIVYYYDESDPAGGSFTRRPDLPGKDDVKGSVSHPHQYMGFILDYGQLAADAANEKAGGMKYKPSNFTFDTILIIDMKTGDIFGPVPNPAKKASPAPQEKPTSGEKTYVPPTRRRKRA